MFAPLLHSLHDSSGKSVFYGRMPFLPPTLRLVRAGQAEDEAEDRRWAGDSDSATPSASESRRGAERQAVREGKEAVGAGGGADC